MPRGQSKTPAEKAQQAVEDQQKTVDKLAKDAGKLAEDVEKATKLLDELKPILEYEKGILDALKRHPALGQAPLPAESVPQSASGYLPEEREPQLPVVLGEEITADTPDQPDDSLDITYNVETPKVDPRQDVDPAVRARGMQSATPADETEPARALGTTARQPWQL